MDLKLPLYVVKNLSSSNAVTCCQNRLAIKRVAVYSFNVL